MHLILTGATGLVGSGVLDSMIKMKDISKISILSRRPVRMADDVRDPRIEVIIQQDFSKYEPEVLARIKGATGCVWALGISQTKVGEAEYVKITKDFALEAAKAFQTLPPEKEPFNFVYVSGASVTTEPGRFSPLFARVKGETELALAAMRRANPLFHAVSVRPAGITDATHDAIKEYVPPRPAFEKWLRPLLPVISALWPNIMSPTEHLGRFLTEVAMGKYRDLRATPNKDITMIGDMPVVENSAFRRLGITGNTKSVG